MPLSSVLPLIGPIRTLSLLSLVELPLMCAKPLLLLLLLLLLLWLALLVLLSSSP